MAEEDLMRKAREYLRVDIRGIGLKSLARESGMMDFLFCSYGQDQGAEHSGKGKNKTVGFGNIKFVMHIRRPLNVVVLATE